MSAKTKLAAPVVLSRSLTEYRLTKKHLAILQRWKDMRAYMKLANKEPSCVRLAPADYADIDAAVRNQSEGQRDLSMVRYEGVPVLSAVMNPQMELVR